MKKRIAALLATAAIIWALPGCAVEGTAQTEQTENKVQEEQVMVINVTKENFEKEVLQSEKTVLLDFWAPWCGPCRMVGPILEEIAQEREDVKICKVNVDEQIELASQYGIVSIPTLLVIENGQVVNQAVGARPKDGILALLP